jgi:hypothetical protein
MATSSATWPNCSTDRHRLSALVMTPADNCDGDLHGRIHKILSLADIQHEAFT